MPLDPRAPWLAGSDLSLRRGRDWLFKGFSFALHASQIMWLRGTNGCGKTSLLRLAVGLARPDEGCVHWRGLPLRDDPAWRQSLVYLGHNHALKDDLTAYESLTFLAQLHGRNSSAQSIGAALDRLGLHHRRHHLVRTLSQGQRKRVALARLALEVQPGAWVLDEPYDTLDAEGTATVNTLIVDNIARGGCVLLTSHVALELGGVPVQELRLSHAVSP